MMPTQNCGMPWPEQGEGADAEVAAPARGRSPRAPPAGTLMTSDRTSANASSCSVTGKSCSDQVRSPAAGR